MNGSSNCGGLKWLGFGLYYLAKKLLLLENISVQKVLLFTRFSSPIRRPDRLGLEARTDRILLLAAQHLAEGCQVSAVG